MTEAQQGTSAAAFVEGGVQDACDDACSICLENFDDDDPATTTTCKHEYHLQCILEWAQRSKECPMCWRPLRFDDPESQSLLAASEQEREREKERVSRQQRSSSAAFLHQRSALDDDAEFYRFALSYGDDDDSDFEDRILHRLAARAADIGRVQQFGRRGELVRLRRRPSGQGQQHHPHCLVVPVNSNPSSTHSPSTPSGTSAGNFFLQSTTPSPDVVRAEARGTSTTPPAAAGQSASGHGRGLIPGLISGGGGGGSFGPSSSSSSPRRVSPVEHVDESSSHPGPSSSSSPSELLASESFKSRLAAASSRYRESLTKTTRGLKEQLGNRARGVSAGVVRALERMSVEPPPDQNRGGSSSSSSSSSAPNAPNTNSSAGIDGPVGTVLVPSGPSCVRGD